MIKGSTTSRWPPHIAALYQEDTTQLRFMKRQQWTITNYLLALLAGIFGIVKAIGGLTGWEKDILLTEIPIAAFIAVVLVGLIEWQMRGPRRRLATTYSYWPTSERVTFGLETTPTSWHRDLPFIIPLWLVCLIGAVIVGQPISSPPSLFQPCW